MCWRFTRTFWTLLAFGSCTPVVLVGFRTGGRRGAGPPVSITVAGLCPSPVTFGRCLPSDPTLLLH